MLPPPLPPAAALKPLNAATAPLAKAPPPGGASSTLPPPLPTPASAPITAPAPKPITAPAPAAIAPAAPRPPASPAAPVTQPPTAPRASVPAVQQPPPPAPPVDDVPSVAQAQEWVGLLDTLLEHRRKHEHLKQREKNLENAEKHRTVPNLNRRPEADTTAMLAATRTEINTLQQSIQTLAERFAISMKAMQVHTTVASTNRTEAGTSLVTTSVPALAGIGPESISQMLSLENTVSKMQSELKLIEAEMASVGDNAKETAKSKEEVRGVKEGLRKEVENRAKEVGEVKKEATAANDKLGEMKRELEGMKMDVGNAYRGLGETKQEVGKVKSQQEMLRAAVERVEQELGDAQKWHGDASVEVERQFKALKQEIAQLRARVQEKGGPEERTKSGKREREASASVPSADAMDVDEVRPVKRVRLSVASAPEDEEPLPAGLTQDIGGPSNERLKEMVDQVQDYIATLENEMVQHHTDTRELLEEFAERIGWEPAALSRGFGAEPAASTRAESAPPPKSPSKLATASGVRSSAPPDISAERTTIIKPSLETLEEGEVASPQELGTDALAPVRKDVENIMEQLLQLWAAKGQWPEIIGRNLAAASGAESLDQVWEKTKTSSGANGLKQVNGTGAHKGQEDVMALVKSMQAEQAKMAQRMADMEVKTSRVEAEKEVMRTKIAEQEKEMNELRSILNDAFKPTNSANEIVDYAVRTDSTPLQQEVEGIKHLAEILPSLLKLADVSAKS
ncbi:hypothetical protein FRC09_012209 [Ceratobasidium sp. 395]|nr:hypothetical protein FRC09_012209 [Ceratobasidium sp. 395]